MEGTPKSGLKMNRNRKPLGRHIRKLPPRHWFFLDAVDFFHDGENGAKCSSLVMDFQVLGKIPVKQITGNSLLQRNQRRMLSDKNLLFTLPLNYTSRLGTTKRKHPNLDIK